jgi:hypothetical protein
VVTFFQLQLPISYFNDLFFGVSLLLAVGTITLLITLEITSSYHGITNAVVNRNKIRNAAVATSVLFLAIISIRVIAFLLNP